MKIDCLLVERISVASEQSGAKVYYNTDNGKDYHSVVVYIGGVDNTHDRVVNYQSRAYKKYQCSYKTADNRISCVSVSIFLIWLSLAFFLKKIRSPDACGISNIVHRIGNDSNASREYTPDKFKNRE